MEFLGIMAVMGIVFSFFITSRSAAARKKRESGGGQQHHGQMGENFPFPASPVPKKRFDPWDFLSEQDEDDEQASEGRRVVPTADEMVVAEGVNGVEGVLATAAAAANAQVADEMMVAEAISSSHVVHDAAYAKNGGAASDKLNFDLRQAVIYSEILKPKYLTDDHIL